jgi:4-alpha-glucanotransferase
VRPLDHLAARLGIEPQFRDASGAVRRPNADVKRKLLAAMGISVQRPADAEHALEALDRAAWGTPLEPVVARRSMLPAAIPLALPASTGDIDWRVDEERGPTHSGTARFADLEPMERLGDRERRKLVLDAELPLGYHKLTVRTNGNGDGAASCPLIVVPDQCYVPERLWRGERAWGLTVQLYALRSQRNWGIGDFTDLKALAELAARLGADLIGLNPLHAGFLDGSPSESPYSPASRLFLSPLYIDVTEVPELERCEEAKRLLGSPQFGDRLGACRDAELIDYGAIALLKLPVLEKLFRAFDAAASSARREAFAAFREERGEALQRFGVWQALHEHFSEQGEDLRDWRRWPCEYRRAGSPAVAELAERHQGRRRFFEWLQWIADQQLEAAASAARAAGLEIGIYRDLAVGADARGAEAWADAPLFAKDVTVGAPADLFNPSGQDWGLPPFDPHALRADGFARFIELIRSNMQHAGALRIDHAMGLEHLYWVAKGSSPEEAAYVTYPFDALVGIIALESVRHRCLVIGEDLGTVPPGFRERMLERGILSYRILFFEQHEDGRLLPPENYPRLALAAVGSHDLAPFKGWWEGRDIELKLENQLYPSDAAYRQQLERRRRDRELLLETLGQHGIEVAAGLTSESPFDASLAIAAHAFLARTSAALAAVQVEDLLEERELVNLPGCAEGYPNWRRRQSVPLETLESRPLVTVLASLLDEIRPYSSS